MNKKRIHEIEADGYSLYRYNHSGKSSVYAKTIYVEQESYRFIRTFFESTIEQLELLRSSLEVENTYIRGVIQQRKNEIEHIKTIGFWKRIKLLFCWEKEMNVYFK